MDYSIAKVNELITKSSEGIAAMANVKTLLSSNQKIVLGLGLGTFTLSRIHILRIIFKQRFLPQKIEAFSIRKEEVKFIKDFCITKNVRGSILIVSGEKGIGKTTAIETALYKFPAAFKIETNDFNDVKNIQELVIKKIYDTYFFSKFIGAPKNGLPRFIFWHKLILGRNPIVIISLNRMNDENFNQYYIYFRNVRII